MINKKVSIACEECKKKNYSLNKSINERLIIKKFCKHCKKHTLHLEEK